MCAFHRRATDRPGPAARGRIRRAWIAFLVVCATPAMAQDPAETNIREGQWIGFGVGAGLDQISCDICTTTPKPGISGYFRFGGTLSERLLLGGEFTGWTRTDDGVRQMLGGLQAVAYWYTNPEGSFYLKGGFGAVGFRSEAEGDALTSLNLGGQFGLGYERRVASSISLVPFANLLVAPFSSLSFNGEEATRASVLLIQAGLGVTWH